MEAIATILKQNNLSVTESRKKILGLFLHASGALEHGDIEKKAGGRFDRVTVYRTLQSFVEKGIVHIIPSPDNSIRYALCKDNCEEGQHHDHHVHLLCEVCDTTYCLDDVVVPAVKLPGGYVKKQVEVLIKGICNKCNKKALL